MTSSFKYFLSVSWAAIVWTVLIIPSFIIAGILWIPTLGHSTEFIKKHYRIFTCTCEECKGKLGWVDLYRNHDGSYVEFAP